MTSIKCTAFQHLNSQRCCARAYSRKHMTRFVAAPKAAPYGSPASCHHDEAMKERAPRTIQKTALGTFHASTAVMTAPTSSAA